MTLFPPRVGRSSLCLSHRLGLAVHGGPSHHQRADKTKRHPPLPLAACGADRLQVHRNSVSCFVHRLSSPCRRRLRAWSTGSRRSCAVVGTSPLLKACRSIAAAWITKLPLSLRRVMGKTWHVSTTPTVQRGLWPGASRAKGRSSRLENRGPGVGARP